MTALRRVLWFSWHALRGHHAYLYGGTAASCNTCDKDWLR